MYYGMMLGPSRRVSRRQREPRYALSFDGVDDYGDLNGISRIFYDGGSVGLFADENETWTVEFWVRPFSVNNNGILGFAVADGTGSGNGQFTMHLGGGSSRPFVRIRQSGIALGLQSPNVWSHYSVTWDGSEALLYFNDDASRELVVGTLGPRNAPILIGALAADPPIRFFHGLKRDLRIWNYARAYEEIVNNMHRKLTGTEPGLIGYWPCDEGHGAIAHDLTAQQNHMIIHGATWVEV